MRLEKRADCGDSKNGQLEGWIYPLKIFHEFELDFQLEGSPRIYSGREILSAARILPQMVQLQYSAEMFTVNEILFAPRSTPGFAVLLDSLILTLFGHGTIGTHLRFTSRPTADARSRSGAVLAVPCTAPLKEGSPSPEVFPGDA
jgi:hypothetical protein